jgi:hypothetical protein
MPCAILPVKKPETNPALVPRRQRDLVALRLHENKRQKSAAGFEMETKNTIVIPTPKENFLQSTIQDLLVDVIQVRQVSVIGDVSGEVPRATCYIERAS